MTDPSQQLQRFAQLAARVDPELSEHDIERLARAAREKRSRRATPRWQLRAGALVLAAVGALFALRLALHDDSAAASRAVRPVAVSSTPPKDAQTGTASVVQSRPVAPVSSAAKPPTAPLFLADGSQALSLDPLTELLVLEDSPRVVRLELRRGRSHFEVSKRPERAFSVRAGNVTISVVGTAFTVELVADRVGVWVDHGIVQVDWGVGHQRLQANDSGWFPPLVLSSQPLDRSARGPRVPLAEREREREPATARPDAGSPQILPDARAASQSMSQSAQELLTAADAARASGHPEQGAELLNRILHEHASDPRAPLAALTLGRLLLNDLGRPREAAAAFREVQRRAPQGPFAEDALAREIEAWVQAGDLAQARALASSYVERYPSGRHLRRVRTVAGIE